MADKRSTARHTCLKLDLPLESSIFVKGTWFSSHFDLAITDGLNAWTCKASEAEVRQRAEQWDQAVEEYVELGERYLGFQQPGSQYGFDDAGNGCRRIYDNNMMLGYCSNSKTGGDDDDIGGGCARRRGGMKGELEEPEERSRSAGSGRNSGAVGGIGSE
ncbi:uncharacterized protein A4U43_C03F28580 [Asparagus officinalis]|uniref:XRCC4 N-terminal domain-containing protein n=1 Tax=Asparagus officinalis TaxID=4686 RepID=A0A5P1FDL4_ASPOF|nr:uncharacterized protein A4U43_C03F28580 [Asparagus officinalis]